MSKKRFVLLSSFLVLVIIAIGFYIFYIADPKPFPPNEQLVEALNELFPEANASEIQDTIFLDEKHVFVPFISKENKYGGSYWEWRMNKWQILSINTRGQPHIWKLDKKDPSTYHIVWNIHQNDKVKHIKFFLIRDRNYHVSNEIETYDPKIQMEEKVSLVDSLYGVLQLPTNWTSFMNDHVKVETAKLPNSFFQNFFPMNQMYYGWTAYDYSDSEIFAELSVNGGSYTTAKIDLNWIMIMNESDLE